MLSKAASNPAEGGLPSDELVAEPVEQECGTPFFKGTSNAMTRTAEGMSNVEEGGQHGGSRS